PRRAAGWRTPPPADRTRTATRPPAPAARAPHGTPASGPAARSGPGPRAPGPGGDGSSWARRARSARPRPRRSSRPGGGWSAASAGAPDATGPSPPRRAPPASPPGRRAGSQRLERPDLEILQQGSHRLPDGHHLRRLVGHVGRAPVLPVEDLDEADGVRPLVLCAERRRLTRAEQPEAPQRRKMLPDQRLERGLRTRLRAVDDQGGNRFAGCHARLRERESVI